MKADLTQTEAIKYRMKMINLKVKILFELQPYQSRGENIVKVKIIKGNLFIHTVLTLRLNLYIKQTLTTTTFHQESMNLIAKIILKDEL